MSERYKKLYHMEHRLYASQAPVLIEAGALLLEQRSNAMLCQLCFLNIQERPIKSLRARVQMLDADGAPLGGVVDHRYQDLDLKREEECGRDSAIVLPSYQAASFTVRVTQVCFADGEIWADEDAVWEELPRQLLLDQAFEDRQDMERFLRRFGRDSLYLPLRTEELWFCTCGAVNHNPEESRCHRCRRRRSALLGRQAEIAALASEEEKSFRDSERQPVSPHRRKLGLLVGTCSLVLLALAAILLLPRLKKPDAPAEPAAPVSAPAALPEAEALLPAGDAAEDPRAAEYARARALQLKAEASHEGDDDFYALYLSAAEAFEALGDYEDSASRAQQCREQLTLRNETLLKEDYAAAQALLENGHYSEARAAFLALGDYEDSAEQAKEAAFRKGEALFLFLDSHSVRGVTAVLSMEAGQESLVALPRDQLLSLGVSGLEELRACFGQDPVRFVSSEDGDGPSQHLEEAAAALLRDLGDYRSSAEMAALLPEMVDRSDEFFALCAAGDLDGARAWLEAWNKPFADRELWLQRLDRYQSFVGDWTLLVGDPNVVPSIGELADKCYDIRCVVILTPEEARLRFLLNEGDETGPELRADLDEPRFSLNVKNLYYLAQINASGSLSVALLRDGAIWRAVEFKRP
jgi:hypothetical protein